VARDATGDEWLAELPDSVRGALTPVAVSAGQTVFAAGDPSDAFYVIVEGSAAVSVPGDVGTAGDAGTAGVEGVEVIVNTMGPGDAFGEVGLLAGEPRTATVRASSPLSLMRLDGDAFRKLVDGNPGVADSLGRLARARRIGDFARLHSAFSALPAEATEELLDGLEEVVVRDGVEIIRQGVAADAMYLIHDGRVAVWQRRTAGVMRRVRTMREGEFFGDVGLLTGGARTAIVRAEGTVRLLRLTRAQFTELVDRHAAFAQRIAEREAAYDDLAPEGEASERGGSPGGSRGGLWRRLRRSK
jgi:CRP-like cAMP-binding protein